MAGRKGCRVGCCFSQEVLALVQCLLVGSFPYSYLAASLRAASAVALALALCCTSLETIRMRFRVRTAQGKLQLSCSSQEETGRMSFGGGL